MTIPFYQTHSDTNAPNYVDYCRSKYWTAAFQGAAGGYNGIPIFGGGHNHMVQTDPYWPIELNECDYVAHIPTIGGKSMCQYTTCLSACDIPRIAVDQFGPAATLGYGAIRRPCRTIYDRCNCLVTGLPASSYASWHTPCRMVVERNGLSCQALCPRIGGCHNPGLTSSGQNYQGFVTWNCNCIHGCRAVTDYAKSFDRAMSFGSVLPVGEYMINMGICQPSCTNCKHCIYFAYTRTNMTREDWIDKDCCCAGWGCANPADGSHNMTYCCLSFCTNGGTQVAYCMCCRGSNQYNVLASCVCANPSQFWLSATSGTLIAYCSACNCHCWTAWQTGPDCANRQAVDHIIGFFCVNPDCVNSSYPCLCEAHTLKRSVGFQAGMFYHLEVNNAPTGKIFTKSVVTDGGPCMPVGYRGFYIIDRANCIACVMSPMWGTSACCCGCSMQGDFIYTSRGTWVGLMSKHSCFACGLNGVCNYPVLVEFNSSWTPLAAVAMQRLTPAGVSQNPCNCFGTLKLAYDPYDDAVIGSVSHGGQSTVCNNTYECTLRNTGFNVVFRLPSCIRCICCAVSYRGCESGPVCCLYYCCCSCTACLFIGQDFTTQCLGAQFYWQKLSPSCFSMYHRGCIATCGISPNSSNPMCGICDLYYFANCIFSQACGCYNGSKCLCTPGQFDSACCKCFRRFEYPLGSAITRCGLLHGCTENPAACYVGTPRSACLVYHCMNGS